LLAFKLDAKLAGLLMLGAEDDPGKRGPTAAPTLRVEFSLTWQN